MMIESPNKKTGDISFGRTEEGQKAGRGGAGISTVDRPTPS
jgi:hypothetical protein